MFMLAVHNNLCTSAKNEIFKLCFFKKKCLRFEGNELAWNPAIKIKRDKKMRKKKEFEKIYR